MVGIQDIASFFTDQKVRTQELIENEDMEQAAIEYFNGVGIYSVCDAADYTGYDLAKEATVKLLQKNDVKGTDIDLIIYIQNRLPQYFMSSSAARLQHDIEATNANTFSLSDLGCTDMSMAIKLAKDFLSANHEADCVLISYGNKPYAPSRFRFPVTINGDGGIALLVTRTAENQIVDVNIKTQGKYWDLFKVEYANRNYAEYKEECTSLRRYGFELAIESKMSFLKLNNDVLEKNGLTAEDVKHYILQNISLRAYDFYESSMQIKFSKACHYNLANYGHLGPSDVMLNYLTGLERGIFQKGEHVLIMNNSPVAAWSNVLIQV
ncbi:3-oxoacyl-[acyl-carrier-protein] synthase III C-terminal domain-containing protein [Chryseolinea lacunae]|uniref:Beta-ketoacyl-[acyl-carrier-protein] synthase III C-terminal domain-containing protein n=1 Tax=Chryseolinea lacunae TaxID=2801331 RepID=A0ABS1KUE8_9BACT|nr:3-oxoacyl-[acyl-carrier-protein] synthase III C-terminal domain-containing protein [Chryseolinea lacunae]MBL0743070.1 hypothetical protein [Chryseolinea lacunae]